MTPERLRALRAMAEKATPGLMTSFDLGEHHGAGIPTMEVSSRAILALLDIADAAMEAETALGGPAFTNGDCGDCFRGLVDGRNNYPDQPVFCDCAFGEARRLALRLREARGA